jgi:hypothetical protein
MRNPFVSRHLGRSLIAAACTLACLGAQAATIQITSRDAPGTGFNDPTPVAPVGGNTGTTLGEQRMNVYRYVASIWEKNLQSDQVIKVSAGWQPLTCSKDSAVLGSAGAWNIWHDFPGGRPGTWYPQALANKLAHTNLSAAQPDDGSGYGNYDIKTQFNINLGNPGCLDGSTFYLGLDGKATGSQVNFVETLLHELGHGLGFSVLTVDTSTGDRYDEKADDYYSPNGLPSIWEPFMYDNTLRKTWLTMTSAERKASSVNPLQLAWTGPNAVAGAKAMLKHLPIIKATSPAPGGNLNIDLANASFGPTPTSGVLGAVAPVAPQAGELGPGCSPFDTANSMAVKGKVALIARGACPFVQKVKNAQNAGAVAVLLSNNTTGIQPPGGSDDTITIPAFGISRADGDALRAAAVAAVPYGSRSKPGAVTVTLGADPVRIAGADAAGRPLLYTPATLSPGSSVSHWDVTATPNLLMEPNISPDLTTVVVPPYDLTLPLLKDIGW